ncbi:MAG TPA: hypothetical protein VK558_03600 [Patescibacteria group bacterium]|nr:hypothetical protein [Patescibacteria group bacterium]
MLKIFLAAALVVAAPAMASAGESKAKGPANEIQARVAPNYVQLPKMRLAVIVDNNRTYSMLELEAWLVMENPEDAAKLGSMKTKITAMMKERFIHYNWEAFKDPDAGFVLAKKVVKLAVDDASHQPVKDVLIRSMILR